MWPIEERTWEGDASSKFFNCDPKIKISGPVLKLTLLKLNEIFLKYELNTKCIKIFSIYME